MANFERSYVETRAERGLTDRVFFDPSNRRRSKIIYSAITAFVALIIWFFVFSVALVSTEGLEAALPDDIASLKGEFPQTGQVKGRRLSFSEQGAIYDNKDPGTTGHTGHNHSGIASIEVFQQQDAANYNCLTPSDQKRETIYATLPSELGWAEQSLGLSCSNIDVLMPSWFDVELTSDLVRVNGLDKDSQEPIRTYAKARATPMQLMPIVSFGPDLAELMTTAPGRSEVLAAVFSFANKQAKDNDILGLCFDGRAMVSESLAHFAAMAQPLSGRLRDTGMQSCVILPADSEEGAFTVADTLFDTVVVRGFHEPWVGSTPQPVAATRWFATTVAKAQSHVSPEKLVIELGTHSISWTSGQPKPEKISYAKAMSALADANQLPQFVPAAGNARATYLDRDGQQHRMWMLDAASAHNQLMQLRDMNVRNVGFGGLGYEDPGLWAVLDQAQNADTLSPDTLINVVFANYVELIGKGPFVSPLSMPVVGHRNVQFDPATNRVTGMNFETAPRAARVRLYGQGQPNKVVLTFDDGPHEKYTAETLDILAETNTPATFYVLGQSALKNPGLLSRILDEGHEIGSHTYYHPNMGKVTAARAKVEMNSVQLLVNGITGKSMRLYREPYMRSGGPVTSREVASLMPMEEAGYIIAGMDVVPRDWVEQSAYDLAKEIIKQVEENSGGVILLHDGGGDQSQTVAALPTVIQTLRSRGYEFTSTADFLNTKRDVLMPDVDVVTSTFSSVSFKAVGNSYTILEVAFWTIFGIGLFRGLLILMLMSKRRRHVPIMKGDDPTVAVVIPAFNEGNVIAKCIRNVLASEYQDFEVIVVDDGSIDDTYDQAAVFASDPRVTVLRQINGGKSSAMNRALFETEAEVLICIDADSQISPQAIGLLVHHFRDPKIGAVAGRVVVGNRNRILTRLQALEYITAQSIERRAKEYLNAITVVPGAIGAWRTTAVMEAGIFSTETLTEDADMTMAIIRSDYKVVYEDRAFATTEAPLTMRGLMAQRLRWSLGMMQAVWKHKSAIGEGRYLGLVSIPDLAIFGYLMPLLAPLADLFLLILLVNFAITFDSATFSMAATLTNPLVLGYLMLPLLEIATVILAFRMDPKEQRSLMLLIPLQRLFYRQVLYISVLRAMWRACTGSLAKWGRATRQGFQFDQSRLS